MYRMRLKKLESTLNPFKLLTEESYKKLCTYLKSSMIQLSKDVCCISVALSCQKLLIHIKVEVASPPRGFDDFENTYGPITFNKIKQEKGYRHPWKADT